MWQVKNLRGLIFVVIVIAATILVDFYSISWYQWDISCLQATLCFLVAPLC